MRRHLHGAEVIAHREVAVEPPAQILVKSLRAVDVGNTDHHDFELHVHRFRFWDFCDSCCRCHNSSFEFPAICEKHFLLLSCLLYLLTVGSFTSSATSEYVLSAQEIHDEIKRFSYHFQDYWNN